MRTASNTRGIFITGTDTGVGKTVVAGALARLLASAGENVGVMKPVETGCRRRGGRLIPADGHYLKRAARTDAPIDLITPYSYRHPLSPYSAATLEKKKINFKIIEKCYGQLRLRHSFFIIEGVGGLLVPMTEKSDLIDLIKLFDLPVFLIARSGLGTLNHTLLSVRYGLEQGIRFLGVILNQTSPKQTLADRTNRAVLAERTDLPILGPLPFFKKEGGTEEAIKRSATLFAKSLQTNGSISGSISNWMGKEAGDVL